ncbi:alpha/beta hydrolase [Chondromyces crocatus]|uniref:alpha/beta hydrolase n=1 Tax=Chondromyces crocatus TaxID=52 RepID=UPI001C54ED5C|nr:alpha/beta hydrolase [Chondromyces crocatus]
MAAPRPSPARLLVGLTASLLVAACSGADGPPGVWESCGGGFECLTLDVPLDHDAPGGPTVALPLVRRRADRYDARLGSLIINPGGPWSSGVSWVKARAERLPAALRAHFDIVGFDPRGSNDSAPGVDCTDDLGAYAALDLTPNDDAARKALADATDALVDGCSARSGDLLPHMGTDSVARDLDLVRQTLGDDRLTFLGFSYGTLLGAVYADRFPQNVRALVLDAAIDPTLTGEAWITAQGRAFEQQLDDFLADCAADTECAFHADGDPEAAYDAIQASLESERMPASRDGTRTLGPGEFAYGVSAALYGPNGWRQLARALALAADGDGAGLLALADGYLERESEGTYGNGLEVYYAVTSLDTPFAREQATYDALVDELSVSAPRLGVYFPYTAFPSARWPVQPWRPAAPIHADGAPPILVVGTTRDPATPHAWAESLAAQLSSGVLLSRDGQGHAAFLKGNTCIDDAVTRYLIEGVPPADGTVCR